MSKDRRKNLGKLSERYFWEEMHHIHCISRSHYTDAKIDPLVFGSIIIFPTTDDSFDYIDHTHAKGIYIQIGRIGLMAILDDCRAGMNLYSNHLSKIDGPLAPFQIREVFSHLCYINFHLEKRPIFSSNIGFNDYSISVELPSNIEFVENDLFTPGMLLRAYLEQLKGFDLPLDLLKDIEENKRTLLFNEQGTFINYHLAK